MTCSPARLAANRNNALRSTGPRTDQGKAISRCNALKHGLAGDGVVLPPGDMAEVDCLDEQLQAELRPSGALGRILVRRVAVMSVRMERCVHHEAAATAERARNAVADFDDQRKSEAEHMLAWLATEPAIFARRLQQTPEGLDLMIREWQALEADLFNPAEVWEFGRFGRAANLMGLRHNDYPQSRLEALCKVLWGDRSHLSPGEADGKDDRALRAWAKEAIAEIIHSEVGRLTALREAVDEEAIALDRAEAPDRALFDASKEAVLARKYEAAAERGMYRALRELRQVEAEAATRSEPATCEALGSSGSDDPAEAPPADPTPGAAVPGPTDPPARPSLPPLPPRFPLRFPLPQGLRQRAEVTRHG